MCKVEIENESFDMRKQNFCGQIGFPSEAEFDLKRHFMIKLSQFRKGVVLPERVTSKHDTMGKNTSVLIIQSTNKGG